MCDRPKNAAVKAFYRQNSDDMVKISSKIQQDFSKPHPSLVASLKTDLKLQSSTDHVSTNIELCWCVILMVENEKTSVSAIACRRTKMRNTLLPEIWDILGRFLPPPCCPQCLSSRLIFTKSLISYSSAEEQNETSCSEVLAV